MKLQIWENFFEIELNNSDLAKEISKNFPINQTINGRYWDEIFSLTNFWLKLDKYAKEVMDIWDISYRVKEDWTKEAIVIFFWNTPAWDWTKPRPVSKCSVIWRIIWDISINDSVWKWDLIILWD